MPLTLRRGALVACSLLCLTLAGASIAQPQAQPGPPAAGAPDGMPHHHMMDPAERQAKMAQRLRAVLQLRPDQDSALQALIAAMKPPAGMDDRMHDPEADKGLSTPARLDKMMARMDEMRADFAARASAIKTFYAQLSPSQQQAFDAMGGHFMHGHGGWGHGDHDGPGPWEHGPWEHGPGDHGPGEHGPMGPDGGPRAG